jgi:hypothetical protein
MRTAEFPKSATMPANVSARKRGIRNNYLDIMGYVEKARQASRIFKVHIYHPFHHHCPIDWPKLVQHKARIGMIGQE